MAQAVEQRPMGILATSLISQYSASAWAMRGVGDGVRKGRSGRATRDHPLDRGYPMAAPRPPSATPSDASAWQRLRVENLGDAEQYLFAAFPAYIGLGQGVVWQLFQLAR